VTQLERDDPQKLHPAAADPPSRWLSAHRLRRLPCARPARRRPHSLRQNESEELAPLIRSQATIGWRKCRNCQRGRSSRRLKSPALEPVHHGRRAEPRQLRHPATAPQRLRRDTGASSSLIHRCRTGTRSAIVPPRGHRGAWSNQIHRTISEASRRSCLSLRVRLAYWGFVLDSRRKTCGQLSNCAKFPSFGPSAHPPIRKARPSKAYCGRDEPHRRFRLVVNCPGSNATACSVPCCTAARAQVFPPEWGIGCALLSS
jgi:hypothetical protein